MAQSDQILGSSSLQGDLYQEKGDVGVGSVDDPKARIHIFNMDVYLDPEVQQFQRATLRPFLITGKVFPIPDGNLYFVKSRPFFTVNKIGNVGINVLDPFTKLHLHSGIFTFTTGNLEEPSANWQIHGTSNAFAIKDQLTNRYRFWINKSNGFVDIGTTSPSEQLEVEGNVLVNNGSIIITGNNNSTAGTNEITLNSDGYIRAREIKVDLDNIPHPDYVFKADYNLMSLEELKTFVETNKHLPNVKSEAEFKTEGSYSLGEMNLKLLEKVEELTLYILDLQAQIDEIKIK